MCRSRAGERCTWQLRSANRVVIFDDAWGARRNGHSTAGPPLHHQSRFGAIHSVVFGGFAARALSSRIADARMRGGNVIPYRVVVDASPRKLDLLYRRVESVAALTQAGVAHARCDNTTAVYCPTTRAHHTRCSVISTCMNRAEGPGHVSTRAHHHRSKVKIALPAAMATTCFPLLR
jgi:hypothetical protein